MEKQNTTEYPLVSIALCTYNGARFLRDQMDSLIAQDYPRLEIIITDDGSSDATVEILKEYAKTHSYIRVIQNDSNLGFVKNFEKAMSLCSGTYIALCDQDDIWLPNKISTLVNHIGEASMIYAKTSLVDTKGTPIQRDFPTVQSLQGRCHMSLLFSNCVTGHTCLIQREVLEVALPIPRGIKVHDHWLAIVAASLSGIRYLPISLTLYRQHDQNAVLGKRKGSRQLRYLRLLKKFKRRMLFLKSVQNLKTLTSDEQAILQQVYMSYSHYTHCFRNRSLYQLMQQHQELRMIYKEDKQLKNQTRGYFGDLFR